MTRKDYIAIAEILSNIVDNALRNRIADDFVRMLGNDNSRFDAHRFLAAVEPNKK